MKIEDQYAFIKSFFDKKPEYISNSIQFMQDSVFEKTGKSVFKSILKAYKKIE